MSKTLTLHIIANNNLKTSLISPKSFTIFSSAKGSIVAEAREYIILNDASLIIGNKHIPIIIITPTIPTAFFRITPQPKTLSTPSPRIFLYYSYK